jgi:simple sugar transport system ATP-binding protein
MSNDRKDKQARRIFSATRRAMLFGALGATVLRPAAALGVSPDFGRQRQAIAVARSVCQRAKLLLLDEPTAAMGAKESALILDLIQRVKEEGDIAIIIIAHNYAQIFDVCDRINLLEGGKIVFDKPTSETSVQELTNRVVNEYRSARRSIRNA